MKTTNLLVVTFALATSAPSLLADHHKEEPSEKKIAGYTNTPLVPGTNYHVHDPNRPQPRKVEAAGPVTTPAPSDATVIFAGEKNDSWKGGFEVKNGILVAAKGGLKTTATYRDVQLHIEWRIPADREVNGQGGGNSGVFFMNNMYEVQILASHTNQTYPDGQAGALYGQFPPLVNSSTPKGEWQSYDIIFKAPVYEGETIITPANITALHNGVVVQAAQALLGPSSHKKIPPYPAEHPERGTIDLQWHSDPIEFRNIWVRDLGERDQ